MLISFFSKQESSLVDAENSTPETVNNLMMALSAGNVALFKLYGIEGYLIIARAEDDRVLILYYDMKSSTAPDFQWGSALDSTLMDDNREVVVDWGSETTPNPIYRTLPSEKALEIALYFLEHEAPPKGLVWDGRMDRFQ